MHILYKLTGIDPEVSEELDCGEDTERLEAVRDALQQESLDSGHTMTEQRFAVRAA